MYPDMTIHSVEQMIADWDACSVAGRRFEMLAVVREDIIVGYASLMERSKTIVSAGIEIFENQRRKGYAADALGQLLRRAGEEGYCVVLDQVRKENQASIALHEKLGFESDGYVYRNKRDHEVLLYLKRI